MSRSIFPLVCAVTALSQTLILAQSTDPSEVRQVAYQDSDTYVEASTDDAGTYDVFYDRLASEGDWYQDDTYGYVFKPKIASDDSWRPYSDGHWVWTDRGWTWVSNESFGWATYHYGRWIRVAGTGWVWVPGNEWAPAWVSWRQTDDNDYCGWAPLPPEATVSVNVGVSSWCDSYYDIGPAAFTFVAFHDFWRPSYQGYYLPEQRNVEIINRTTNITNIAYNNNVINNYGPQYQRVSQITAAQGHPLQTYKVNYAAQAQRNAAFKTAVQGNQLNVVAPPQKLKSVAKIQPQGARSLGNAQVQRGWQNVPQTQQQQIRQTLSKQGAVPAGLPQKPVAPAKPQIVQGTQGAKPTVAKPETVKPGGPANELQTKPGTVQKPVRPGENTPPVTQEHKQETVKPNTTAPINPPKEAHKAPTGPNTETRHVEQHATHQPTPGVSAHHAQPETHKTVEHHPATTHASQPHPAVQEHHVTQQAPPAHHVTQQAPPAHHVTQQAPPAHHAPAPQHASQPHPAQKGGQPADHSKDKDKKKE
jgi:hypothetical protein